MLADAHGDHVERERERERERESWQTHTEITYDLQRRVPQGPLDKTQARERERESEREGGREGEAGCEVTSPERTGRL